MEEQIIQNQKESIKLMKMSKGYNWEIKLFVGESKEVSISKRLELFDKDLREKFGEELHLEKGGEEY